MKLIRNALAFGAIAAASVVACSSQHGSGTAGSTGNPGPQISAIPGAGGDTGSIKAALTISGGNLYSLNYTCTGPSTIPPGTVNFNDAQSVEWVLGGIVAGTGYQCVLTGTDSNGDPCSGTSSTFSILPGQVTGAGVNVICTVATDASLLADVNQGSVAFEGGVMVVNQGAFACPGINSFSISPAEVIGSQPAQLGLSEIGSIGLAADGGPTTSDIIWTATCGSTSATPPIPCGSFSPSANAASPTFTCGADQTEQVVTITAQVTGYQTNISTGVTSNVCQGAKFTTMTSTIDCEGGGTFSCVGTPATPNACVSDAGNKCVNFNTDPLNCGGCGTPPCTGATPNCVAGVCVATPPGGPCTQLVGATPADSTGNTNCIKCNKSANNLCSGTEAIIVTRDTTKGLVSANVPTAGSCYACLAGRTCIDSTTTTGTECEDLTGLVGGTAPAGYTKTQGCLDTLNCVLGNPQVGTAGKAGTAGAIVEPTCSNNPPPAGDGTANCFCGTAEPDFNDCSTADKLNTPLPDPGLGVQPPNGVCDTVIVNALGLSTNSSNVTLTNDLGDSTLSVGQAFLITNCGGATSSPVSCPQCFN